MSCIMKEKAGEIFCTRKDYCYYRRSVLQILDTLMFSLKIGVRGFTSSAFLLLGKILTP